MPLICNGAAEMFCCRPPAARRQSFHREKTAKSKFMSWGNLESNTQPPAN